MDVNEELKFLGKFTKTNSGGREGGQVGGVGLVGGQDGCERRIEVFVKIQKQWGGEGGGVGSGVWLGGQGGCERRIEVFGKIHKKKSGGGVGRRGQVGVGLMGGGVRVDVNKELKFLGKFTKKWGGPRGRVGGSGWM